MKILSCLTPRRRRRSLGVFLGTHRRPIVMVPLFFVPGVGSGGESGDDLVVDVSRSSFPFRSTGSSRSSQY